MAIFNKKKPEAQATSPSDENAKMLPPEKQSKSDISTKQTNTILLFIAFIMLGIFMIGAIFTANKNQNDVGAINEATSKETTTTTTTLTETFTYVSPIVSSDPQTVRFENIIIGNETFNSIMISVANNPVKINDISFSAQVDGLSFDEDCTQRESITPEAGCIINLVWNPTKVENKNIFLLLTYNDPDTPTSPDTPQGERGKNRTFKINVALSSMERPEQRTQTYNEEDEDDFYDEEEYDEEEEEEEDFEPATQKDVNNFTNAVAPAISQSQNQRTMYPDDCKKYASKAYDFSGTFIGWVQKNNDVFSPNCTKVIGSLQEDGMVLETATGKLIGKGAVFDKKKSEEKRIELIPPSELNDIIETVNSENFNPDFEQVWQNRMAVKTTDVLPKKESTEEYDLYKADDPLNIIGKQKNALVPFSITASSQISSMPKDERYVLRQAKPIPAVLNRPIYFGNIDKADRATGTIYKEDETTAVATVERNVYGGDGRTIIIPSGSQLIGKAQANTGAGLQEIEKISIKWDRLIRPDGAEFDLSEIENYTADAQGREGVPGKNDTEYMRDLFIKPLLYSVLPVAMEALFPTSSQFVTRAKRSDGTYQALNTFIDEDGESGVDFASDETTYGWDPADTQTIANMSSKDKMKLEIEQNWKTTMQKLMEQSAQQSIPFTVAAGTRIMVFLDQDVMLRIDENMTELFGDSQYDQ